MTSFKKTINNVCDAFKGKYVARDKRGIDYKDIYMNMKHPVGKEGIRIDKRNVAKDMHSALRIYEQKKR